MRERPLSPHLSIYKFRYPMATSITNRATGIVLSVALLLFAYWAMAVAAGPVAYASAVGLLSHWFAKLVYLGAFAAWAYHTFNGIRHLVWDTGRGMERPQTRASANVVMIATIVAVLAFAWFLFSTGGAA
jgi:succinate dehydrogenase / fumarate reductase cytochrome b subunit